MSEPAILPELKPMQYAIRTSLIYEFKTHGYSDEEAIKNADIARRVVESALKQADYVFNLHLEAMHLTLSIPEFIVKPELKL